MRARRQRLALFLPNLGGGGAERVALALLQGFVERGHLVDLVLAERRGVLLPLIPEGVEIFDLGAPKLRQALVPLARYLRQRQPHALHAMMWPLPLLAIAARAIARVGTRIIGSEHTTLSTMPYGLRHRAVRALTARAYLKANGLVAVSEGVANDLATFVGIPREQITVIYNPLQLPATLPDSSTAISRWPAGTIRILAVGAIKSEKNYPLLLRALARVRERVQASLLIVGDGPLRGLLEAQIAEAALGDAVVLVGFDLDPWPYYAAADVFVLSSDFEGFGNVLVEALHAGLPVVSTDCPNGPGEILGNGSFGTLVPCRDEVALAAAITEAAHGSVDAAILHARALELSAGTAIESHLAQMIGD